MRKMIKNIARIAAVPAIMAVAVAFSASSYASSSADSTPEAAMDAEMTEAFSMSEASPAHEEQIEIKNISGGVDIVSPSEKPVKVMVYTLTGKIVKSFDAHYGSNFVELTPGYYIIRIDRLSHKVIVK